MTARRSFFLPIEIKARELDATILLACVLAEGGHQVWLGNHKYSKRTAHTLPPLVYLGRTVTQAVGKRYRWLRDMGHCITALDEEGLVIYSQEIYRTRRIGRETIRIPQALFAWGPANAAIWGEELGDASRIHITGNPRFDLLRAPLREIYRQRAAAYQARFGRYVLFNSNFHWVNTRDAAATRLPDPDDVAAGRFPVPAFYNPDLARYRIRLFRAYLEALPRLARSLPQLHFIIRPHPAENPAPWQKATAHLPNCTVLHEGEVTPWILGSEAVLHHSCTTAVEATVLGKPVVCYRPYREASMDPQLPIQLSLQAEDPDTLRQMLTSALAQRTHRLRPQQEALLGEHVAALDGPLASERIADILETVPFPQIPRMKRLRSRWRGVRKQLQRRLLGETETPRRDVFPPTPVAEINQRIAAYARLLNRFDGIEAVALDTNYYCIRHVERP
ncbi:hypothetical protein MIT9_P1306 [Methylomarinovum caldicuralii]|uniref:Surface carbohydrate biosynthesis protein n=1 Tax=Methylomarinovum caldicuralii TaxID=438856 RepID=A0AAU9CP56_9GAMM|nr:surface carbohydrate biosynthesis protein [Methylomarinovum caldicuralii]BCX81728.1 hypothetical protein MIT9_P1306 [Methylomarinovum caldicuralii]